MQRDTQNFVDVLEWLGSVATAGELRSEPRVEVSAPVTLRHAGGSVQAETRDITPSGICVMCDGWSPQPGEQFTLDLPLPSAPGAPRSIRCVVRNRAPAGADRFRIGAAFVGND